MRCCCPVGRPTTHPDNVISLDSNREHAYPSSVTSRLPRTAPRSLFHLHHNSKHPPLRFHSQIPHKPCSHNTLSCHYSPIIPRIPRPNPTHLHRASIQPLRTFIPPPGPHRITPSELFTLLFNDDTGVEGFIIGCWLVRWVRRVRGGCFAFVGWWWAVPRWHVELFKRGPEDCLGVKHGSTFSSDLMMTTELRAIIRDL